MLLRNEFVNNNKSIAFGLNLSFLLTQYQPVMFVYNYEFWAKFDI